MLPSFTVFLTVQYNVIILILVDIHAVYLIILSNLGWVTPVKKIMGWVGLDPFAVGLGQKYGSMSISDLFIHSFIHSSIHSYMHTRQHDL